MLCFSSSYEWNNLQKAKLDSAATMAVQRIFIIFSIERYIVTVQQTFDWRTHTHTRTGLRILTKPHTCITFRLLNIGIYQSIYQPIGFE